jgi:hypothetical protein
MTYFSFSPQTILLAFASFLAFSPVNGDSNSDPALGLWRLNQAKCQFSSPVPSTTTTRSYQPAAGGLTRISETRLPSDGQQMSVEYVVSYDGKEYPVFVTDGDTSTPLKSVDTVSLRRVDRHTVAGVFRHHGNKTSEFSREVSKDGQTLYVRIVGIHADGSQTLTLLVYDRLVT